MGEDEEQHDRRQSADGQDQEHEPEVKQRQMKDQKDRDHIHWPHSVCGGSETRPGEGQS